MTAETCEISGGIERNERARIYRRTLRKRGWTAAGATGSGEERSPLDPSFRRRRFLFFSLAKGTTGWIDDRSRIDVDRREDIPKDRRFYASKDVEKDALFIVYTYLFISE